MGLGREEKSSETDSSEAFRALNIDIAVSGISRCASRVDLRSRTIHITFRRLEERSFPESLTRGRGIANKIVENVVDPIATPVRA